MKLIGKASLSTAFVMLLVYACLGGSDAIMAQPTYVNGIQAELYASPSGSGNACTQADPCSLEG
ncbi:hypothetical protein PA598K_07085, partial [Paenibacillus sp. 598K]|uniref:hypothetical protein n=1 Tax=Paenibacillus sp. 598K TaxID=1117987 RepID=UPI000FF9CB15